MEEKKLTSLIFGNVVIESQLLGAQVRIYGENMRSYYFRPSPYIDIVSPLDELRGKVDADRARLIAERIFDSVENELNQTYPGGVEKAQNELANWLTDKNS